MLWYWGRRGGGAHYTAGLVEALSAYPSIELVSCVSSKLECLDRVRKASPILRTFHAHDAKQVPSAIRRLRAVAVDERVDVVLHSMVNPLTPIGLVVLPHELPVVTVIHDAKPHPGDRHALMDFAGRFAARRSTRIIAASDHVAYQLVAHTQAAPIDVVRLGPHLDLPDMWDPDGPVVFLGRLRSYKGLDLLAESWAAVPSAPGRVLRIMGEGDPGDPALDRLRALGADVRVGWIPDNEMESAIRGARLVVLPYREATQSGVVTLAAAARIPVLATDVGALRSQVGDGGVVVEPTVAAFAESLTSLFDNAERLRSHHDMLVTRPSAAQEWKDIAGQISESLRRAIARGTSTGGR